MGTIAVTEDQSIGAANWFIRSILSFCIEKAGKKKYLVDSMKYFENGYNCMFVYKFSNDEKNEFLFLLNDYVDQKIHDEVNSENIDRARNIIFELIDKIKLSLG